MKREIKFRGLKNNGKDFVYGDYIRLVIGGNVHHYIKPLDSKRVEVIPETVGQFTGLKDKNGVEIYEGDIDSEGFVFEYNTNMGGWYRMKNGEGLQWHAQSVIRGKLPFEIIGNIHEHKHLLE